MKIASTILICLIALAFVSGTILTSFADPVDPPTTPDGNPRPHKGNPRPHKSTTLEDNETITPDGNPRPHRGNPRPH
ncbi:MAG: hypothetical protein OEY83_06980 [Candidatus Bathyarchaeota archaeon]|nr:hypothetical protein [Candidatus Bathyarchaeota archaeon]